jgi:ATP-dependent DNA helicase RecQ
VNVVIKAHRTDVQPFFFGSGISFDEKIPDGFTAGRYQMVICPKILRDLRDPSLKSPSDLNYSPPVSFAMSEDHEYNESVDEAQYLLQKLLQQLTKSDEYAKRPPQKKEESWCPPFVVFKTHL